MLIGICRLVAEGMLLTKEKGVHKLAAFVDDEHMHKLYEAFILEYYKQEHPWIRIEPPEIQWDIDDGVFDRLPRMISDVTLTHGNKTLIIDAKYYSRILQQYYDAHTIRSMHLYQIYSYVKNKAAAFPHQEVSGLLLYARTDESIQPNDSYEMGGNTIGVQTLDLNKEFSSIAGELDEIARKFLIGEQFYG
jgi:5-methylcytosine-specific restriction enzyme subunit McrC